MMHLTTSEVYNTGGGCLVLFMDVDHLFLEQADSSIKQLSYDGDSIAAITQRYQDSEEGLMAEDTIWVAYSWEDLIETVGIDLALDIYKQIQDNWKYTDCLKDKEAINSIVKLIEAVSAMSQLYDNWHTNVDSGYPFKQDMESQLIEMFNWQQTAIGKLRK